MNLGDVTQGDTRKALEATRDKLAEWLSTVKRADAVAPIAKALVDVVLKIDALPNDAEGSVTNDLQDELAKLRAKRPVGPAGSAGVKDAAGN